MNFTKNSEILKRMVKDVLEEHCECEVFDVKVISMDNYEIFGDFKNGQRSESHCDYFFNIWLDLNNKLQVEIGEN